MTISAIRSIGSYQATHLIAGFLDVASYMKKLTDDDILIIGTGAIGSSLYMSLLRGGCRKVTISDGDTIEPGNLCRALHFSFFESGFKKTDILS